MSGLQSLRYLAGLTARRQLASRKSLIVIVLLSMLCLVTILYIRRHAPGMDADPEQWRRETVRFSRRILMGLYLGLFIPIVSLIYGTSAIGEERDDQTLVYLLSRSLSRFGVYLAKALGTLPVIVAVGLGGYALVCVSAGGFGSTTWQHFWPAVSMACLVYGALFLLFGALLPRPVVLSVVYAFFCETMVGNMPGTVKRVSVSFYCRCMMFADGAELGLEVRRPAQFLPISGDAAFLILCIALASLLAVGALAFHRKEFHNLG